MPQLLVAVVTTLVTLWSLRRLALSNARSKGFYNIYHKKCWVKTPGENKEIKWLNIVNFSLHVTAPSEDRLYAIFVPKEHGSQFTDFICLYANRLNINIEGIKQCSFFSVLKHNQRKEQTLFTMAYILFRYVFLVSFSDLLPPKTSMNFESRAMNGGIIKVNQISFLSAFFLREKRKSGGSAETSSSKQDFWTLLMMQKAGEHNFHP